jgi:hypothetical protein
MNKIYHSAVPVDSLGAAESVDAFHSKDFSAQRPWNPTLTAMKAEKTHDPLLDQSVDIDGLNALK